jgi:tetratricopeptide (TPR) repeat protein
MSPEKERVEPAPFDSIPQTDPRQSRAEAASEGPPRWMLPALALLVLLALGVVFWLPDLVSSREEATGPTGTRAGEVAEGVTDASGPSGSAGTTADRTAGGSPFADAEAACLRSDAQDILDTLLDLRDTLEKRGAGDWAADRLAAVNAAAEEGDALYRQRQFETAIDRYEDALTQAREIEAQIPEEAARQREALETALQSGALEQARAALAALERVTPEAAELAALRGRVEALPALLAALDSARRAEAEDNLAAARDALREAVGIDAEHREAQSELQRVSTALEARRFTRAMTEGYAALEDERFADARSAFGRAGALREGSPEVAAALEEVKVAQTASRLRALQGQAETQVADEAWAEAVESYEAALEIDGSVLFAQRGLQEARTRAELDQRLRGLLEDPDRLSDREVAASAEELLAYARQVEPRGPVLREQIRELQQRIELANTPIAVTFLSDNATEVVVLRVLRLGQFEREELELRPGEYTAVGTRRGYRDVRETFRVSHGERVPTVTVVCTEAI